MVAKHPDADFTVLWDGKAAFRYEIFPEYKANRVAKTEEEQVEKNHYQAQVPFIRAVYQSLGIKQIIPESLEADDLAGYMTGIFSRRDKVILYTGDSDWWQMINENVTWIDPRKDDRVITMANFQEKTGYFTPEEYLQGKAMYGDSADGIPPIGGIGEKGAVKFLAQFRSVENFWKLCDEGAFVPTAKAHISLWKGEARANWERNMKLMRLGGKPQATKFEVINKPLNETAFRAICEKLAFISILKNYENYIQPFRARQVKEAA
jgi:5'-3' exonuclease